MLAPSRRRGSRLLSLRKVWKCSCGQPIFFRNDQCLNCGAALGYLPEVDEMLALDPAIDGTWLARMHGHLHADTAIDPAWRLRRCANHDMAAACNWLVVDGVPFCLACRLNRTIPDLSFADNAAHWQKIELAKRRLIAQLANLGLPIAAKEADERGLAFDFLAPGVSGTPPTGHCDGIITLNVLEASDLYREQMRARFSEPYRTLLGHLRHEIGHYYWYRLIEGSQRLDAFRSMFGDERVDYQQALKRHYDAGAPADWQLRFVSAYASVHPWEDWAESWAHYLHIVDTLDTAVGFGMDPSDVAIEFKPFTREALSDPTADDDDEFLSLINGWVQLATMLNELSRSLGQPDFYPFVLSISAVRKLHFIHGVIAQARAGH